MEHGAHELESFTFSATGDVSLPLNFISAAMLYLLHAPFIVDVRARKDAGPYRPFYFRGLSICFELAAGWIRKKVTREVS